jgi:hypothetical protein
MSYGDGEVSILTSNEFVNSTINQLDSRKRTIRKSAYEYYLYKQASNYEIDAFVKRMAKGGKYNEEERRIVPNSDKEKPSEKELNKVEIINDKSPQLMQLEEEEKKQLSAEELELKALEAELKALEDQKAALQKAKAEKGVELEEFSTENKKAPNIEPAPKKAEPETETPKEETPIENKPAETEKKDGEETEDDEIPKGPRATPEETPEEKKESEPEKKEEGESMFDSMFK